MFRERMQNIHDRRNAIAHEQNTIVSQENPSAEDLARWDALDTEFRQLDDELRRLKTQEERNQQIETITRDARMLPGGDGDTPAGERQVSRTEEYREAWEQYVRHGSADLTREQRSVLQQGYQSPDARAQTLTTGQGGGYLVPEAHRGLIIETMNFFGGMRQVSQVISTENGADLPWATNDDTNAEGEILGVDGASPTEQNLTFGQKTLRAYVFSSKWVKVPIPLLQDSYIDLGGFVGRKLGERIGRRENRVYTTGSGIAQPQGVVSGVTTGKTGANGQTTTVIWTDLIDLEHSVDVAYRNERSRWMFHDLTLSALRKLKDDEERPIWQAGLQVGAPDLMHGRPYTVNNHMPQMAASAKSIIFGDFFAGYVIREVAGISMVRAEERFVDDLQVGFLAWARMDGMIQDPNALRAYTNAGS